MSNAPTDRARRGVLAAGRDRYLDGLQLAFGGMLDRLDDALFELAERGDTEELRAGYFDVMRQLRLTREELLHRFLDVMGAVWDGASGPDSAMLDQAENMALTLAVRCAEAECGEALAALRRQLVPLGSRTAAQALAPKTLYGAFEQVCAGIEASVPVRLILLKFFERHVGAALPELYRALLTTLADGAPSDLPGTEIATHGGRLALGPHPESAQAPAAPWAFEGVADAGQGPGGGELGQLLRQVVRGEGTPGQVEVLKLLATQQHSDRDGILSRTASLDLSRIAGEAPGSGVSVNLAVDMLALLYDGLYVDSGVNPLIKVQLARLQLPLLKLALRDAGFLARRSHGARRFFNALVALGRANTQPWPANDEARLSDLVDEVAERCADDPEVFNTAAATLASLGPLRDSTRPAQDLDRIEAAEQAAHAEINARIIGRALPDMVSSLLEGHWRRHLVELYVRHGPEGSSWRRALGTADALLWAVAARDAPEARLRLSELRPRLIRQLRAGLDDLGMPASDQELLYAELRRLLDEGVYTEPPASEIRLSDLAEGSGEPPVTAIVNSAGQEISIDADGDEQDQIGAEDFDQMGADEVPSDENADWERVAAVTPGWEGAEAAMDEDAGEAAGELHIEGFQEPDTEVGTDEGPTGSPPSAHPAGEDPLAQLLRQRGVDTDTLVIEEIVLTDTPGVRGEVLALNRDRRRD